MNSTHELVNRIDVALLSNLQPLLSAESIPFFASSLGTNPPVFLGKFKYYRKISSLIAAIFYTVYYKVVSLHMLERIATDNLEEDQLVSTMQTVLEIMNVHLDHPYELEDSNFSREFMARLGTVATSLEIDELFEQIKCQTEVELLELNCNPMQLDLALQHIFASAIQAGLDTTNS